MVNQLSTLILSLRDFIAPLSKDFSSLETLEFLFYRYGWTIVLKDEDFTKINQLAAVAGISTQLIKAADALRDQMDSDPNFTPGDGEIESLITLATQLYEAIDSFTNADLSSLPEPLDSQTFWTDIADQWLNDLQETFLRIYYPKLYLFLHLFGIIRYESVTLTDPHRADFMRTVVDWSTAGDLVENPFAAFSKIYHWDDPARPFDHLTLLSALQNVLRAIGLSASLGAPNEKIGSALPAGAPFSVKGDEASLRLLLLYGFTSANRELFEMGLDLLPAIRPGETVASGLMIRPVLRGGLGVNFPLNKNFNLQWNGAADASNTINIGLFPDKTDFVSSLPAIATSLTFSYKNKDTPWYLFGKAGTTRIELSGASITISVDGAVDDPEIKLEIKTGADASSAGCKFVIPLDASDNFIKGALGSSDIEFSFGAGLIWSSKTGLRINGQFNFDFQLPLHIAIGSVSLENAHIELKKSSVRTGPAGIELRVGTRLQGDFGPVSFLVEDMGFSATATPYSKEDLQRLPPGSKRPLLGNLDLGLQFAPPKGIGISVDAQAVKGAGYLYFDTDKGQYAGVAELTVKDTVNVKAIGIILTHMPDGSPGYSFFLLISGEFAAIQLGLGFSLTGVGGLIGIHRGIDVEKLRQGIFNNDISNVLFPADPLHNAPAIIGSIDRLFPAKQGQYTFGLMANLAWGPENIITIELGLILEFPDPVRIALVGVLRSVVKKELGGRLLNVLQLQVNFAGTIDFDAKFIRFDATLVQSKLLDMGLEGDMALRVKYGDNPDFAVTLGGFHPDFQPPALDLPAKMKPLQIILRSGNPSITVGCYLAVTSNTIQFGLAGLFLFKKWGVGIRGELSFDALFQLDPFHFETDVHFLLAASWKGYDFASIEVNGSFTGPSPWSMKASLKLKVWIFSKTVHLDESWGDEDDALPEGIRILPILAADLGNMNNWERKNGSTSLSVTIRKKPDAGSGEEILSLHPNELLSVRQGVVPLGVQIDKYSARKPQGASTFSLSLNKGNTTVPATTTQGHFAAAQFMDMDQAQQLHAPSYELFDAGLSFDGLDAVVFDQLTVMPVSYETSIIVDAPPTPAPALKAAAAPGQPAAGPLSAVTVGAVEETALNFSHGLRNNALANSAIGKLAAPKKTGTKKIGEKYFIVDQRTFKPVDTPPVSSEAQARQILQQLKAADLFNQLSLAVLPAAEMN